MILIHGGAGVLAGMSKELQEQYRKSLKSILQESYRVLQEGGSCVDVVEFAVTLLENDGLYNAGYGSVFTKDQTHEMDASIMQGQTLKW